MLDRGAIILLIEAMGAFCLLGIISIFVARLVRAHKQRQLALFCRLFSRAGSPEAQLELEKSVRRYPDTALEQFRHFRQSCEVRDPAFQSVVAVIARCGLEKRFVGMLRQRQSYKRIKAAVHLAVLPGSRCVEALEQALKSERDWQVRLYLCSALAEHRSPSSIPFIVNTIYGAPLWYRNKVSVLLHAYEQAFHAYLPALFARKEIEVQALITDFAAVYVADDLRDYLLRHTASDNRDIAYRSVRALGTLYPEQIDNDAFFHHPDPVVRNIVLEAMANFPSEATLHRALSLLTDEKSGEHAVMAVSNMARLEPRYLPFLLTVFHDTEEYLKRQALAKVLSNRIEHLLLGLLSPQGQRLRPLIGEIIASGKVNGVIGFLNKNRNRELENEILPLVKAAIGQHEEIKREFSLYLDERMLEKIACVRVSETAAPRDVRQELGKKLFLVAFLLPAIGTLPFFYLVRHWPELYALTWQEHLQAFVVTFNYFIGYYSFGINSIYLLLLCCSFFGIRRQKRFWKIKSDSFLFTPRMIPSVSIIAPAYGEEATIVDNVHSLLNLKYPNYELIVVNDGSKDETLNCLIRHFNLEKVDRVLAQRLKTKPIRGIYVNKDIPKLVVIDKANGGKADSLNAGINLSKKEYFCGIDADSLLEQKALLRLASLAVDAKNEAVALGGNIFPVNGCRVTNGMIVEWQLPSNFWARLQTVEYLRAFMAGRIGWAYLKSLMIISGAFGLFKKDRVIDIGGYMTSSERFQRDTVGEDMELVVRLTRNLHEKQVPHAILYGYNANCWTEVPEKLAVLERQRDRWQRGLLDIIAFHRKLLFNPAYGRAGMVAMPYFLLFEMVGPLLEIQGYFMVVVAFCLGMLEINVALLLFAGSVLLGILVSVYSLLLAEQDVQYYSAKEVSVLILTALVENFGVRQLISFWRISGYLHSLNTDKGWGTMVRKGFAVAPETHNG